MDRRGLTSDPNASQTGAKPKWWQTLGSTLGPQPYATAAWQYKQTKVNIRVEVPVNEVPEVYDGGTKMEVYLHPIVWDNGFFNQQPPPAITLDSGGFSKGGRVFIVQQTNATVIAYDTLASAPGDLNEIEFNLGELAIDPPSVPPFLLTTEDGLELSVNERSNSFDHIPPGNPLGQLDYELVENTVTITNWSQLNWYDDEPVRKCFFAMKKSLPHCATIIKVKDDPTGFWAGLGFVHEEKGGDTLVYSDPNAWRPY